MGTVWVWIDLYHCANITEIWFYYTYNTWKNPLYPFLANIFPHPSLQETTKLFSLTTLVLPGSIIQMKVCIVLWYLALWFLRPYMLLDLSVVYSFYLVVFYILFIHSPAEGHGILFSFKLLLIMLLWIFHVYLCDFYKYFCLSCVELFDYKCLTFKIFQTDYHFTFSPI